MVGIVSKPDTHEKLRMLSADAQYDLACACGTSKNQGRRRGAKGKWIYPVTLPNGGTSVLFKTLMSSVCTSDCKYCPLRRQQDVRRCSLGPDELVKVFLDYYDRREVFGLFLSSGALGSADAAMQRLNDAAAILRRKHRFKGYIHLKIIPGASPAAVEDAVSLADAVSINIETPGHRNLAKLSDSKQYVRDIIEPIKLVSRLTARGARHSRVKQTTQFIVGAAAETDAEIVKYMWGLYDRLDLHRVYFSAYQTGLGDKNIPGEQAIPSESGDIFMREHRLYQVDFLMRRYGFTETDIVLDPIGNLPLAVDPKEAWATSHPQFFPVDVNRASKHELLRVPGLGPITVRQILRRRRESKIRHVGDMGKPSARLRKAASYLAFWGF